MNASSQLKIVLHASLQWAYYDLIANNKKERVVVVVVIYMHTDRHPAHVSVHVQFNQFSSIFFL